MAAELGFVVALSAFTAAIVRWARSDLQNGAAQSRLGAFAGNLVVFAWLYAAVGAASSETWRVGVPKAPAVVGGVLVALVGVALVIAGVVELQNSAQRGAKMTSRGVYARVRHPQALGAVLLLTGLAITGRSLFGLLLAALFALFAWRYTRIEEQFLRRASKRYERYLTSTPAVPRTRRPAETNGQL